MYVIVGVGFLLLCWSHRNRAGDPNRPRHRHRHSKTPRQWMSYLYEKSATWRWIVASSRTSRRFFLTFSTLCVVLPLGLGYATMSATSSNDPHLQHRLSKHARQDTDLMTKVNKERLGQLLKEIQSKENTEDRYAAALRGETLTGTPDARVRGGGGTSWRPLVKEEKDEK